MVKNQLAEITRAVENLGELLAKKASEIKKSEAEKDRIQKELWSVRKEMTPLQRIAADFDEVNKENETLSAQHEEVKKTLQGMLKQVKALSAEFRP